MTGMGLMRMMMKDMNESKRNKNRKKGDSEKMRWLLNHIPFGSVIVEKYDDKYITEVTIKEGGDYLTYRLYETSGGEWIVTQG